MAGNHSRALSWSFEHTEVVPERMAGWRWSDWLPDEDKGHSMTLGGLGGSRMSRRCAPVGGHAVVSASTVRGRRTCIGGLADMPQ